MPDSLEISSVVSCVFEREADATHEKQMMKRLAELFGNSRLLIREFSDIALYQEPDGQLVVLGGDAASDSCGEYRVTPQEMNGFVNHMAWFDQFLNFEETKQ